MQTWVMAKSEDAEPPEMSPEEHQAAAAQVPIVSTAYRFLEHFYSDDDLTIAWDDVDPVLRLCWAQWWLDANRRAIVEAGYGVEEVAAAFVRESGTHPLWPDFERVILRDLRRAHPLDVARAGIGMTPRPLDVDVELLYAHHHVPEGGQWESGATSSAVALVLRLSEGRWRVLNLGYERIPEPGLSLVTASRAGIA